MVIVLLKEFYYVHCHEGLKAQVIRQKSAELLLRDPLGTFVVFVFLKSFHHRSPVVSDMQGKVLHDSLLNFSSLLVTCKVCL